jgi:hypothetical protein
LDNNSLSFLFQPVTHEIQRRPQTLVIETYKRAPSLSFVSGIVGSHFGVAQACKGLPTPDIVLRLCYYGWKRVITETKGLRRCRAPQ